MYSNYLYSDSSQTDSDFLCFRLEGCLTSTCMGCSSLLDHCCSFYPSRILYFDDQILELVGQLQAFLRIHGVVVVEHPTELSRPAMIIVDHQLAEVQVRRQAIHADAALVLLAQQLQVNLRSQIAYLVEVGKLGLASECLQVLFGVVEVAEPGR